MRFLLDTSALLAHFRKEAGWEAVQKLFDSGDAEIMIASITIAEFGRRLLDLGASEADAHEIIINYRLLCDAAVSVDADVAMNAFAIAYRTPRWLPLVDALIAATAESQKAILVHRDKHMRTIPDNLVQQNDLSNAADD